jgi:16S rRNA (adenine1518-N6/adenine1519-N6)-dimethyltransferase
MIVDRAGIRAVDVVLEIGAGLGALTIPLAACAGKVYAVEKDQRLIPLLKTELTARGVSNVELMEKNILDIDIRVLSEHEKQKIIVMGNLPYNLSSRVLIQLIRSRQAVNRAVFMLQKEVALRIMALPGGRDYGRLSVMLQYCSRVKRLAGVRAPLFFPRPKVDSEVLELRFKEMPDQPATDEAFLYRVVKAAFGKRRKTLKNALSGSLLRINGDTARQVLIGADIDPARRAESLTVEEFVKLSNAILQISSATETTRSPSIFT